MKSFATRSTTVFCLILFACHPGSSRNQANNRANNRDSIVIDLADGPVNTFTPDEAFGAVVDGLGKGRVKQVYSRYNIRQLKRAGLRPIVYNLRTELAIEAWHWSEEGSWSDPGHHQGYWTGSDRPHRPVLTGWGYKLPRRGDSTDQANDDGYSRIDDGDPKTFWKSNPYLDSAYTHRAARPQWVVINFPSATPISAVRIRWAKPFARRFAVQYWTGADEYDDEGRWLDFPHGGVTRGTGGDALLALSDNPIRTRSVRVLLQESSFTSMHPSKDRRDALGYAIREIDLGAVDANGHFRDAIKHVPSGSDQTNIYVSSTDPWHRAIDRDPDVEQPGFDRIFRTGLNNGLPLLLTVGTLYDTPENTAAQMRFLRLRHYPVQRVEIGLEPDGQNIAAEDFADLFTQTARAVRSVDTHATLAGPGLQDAISDTWLDDSADHSWTHRFLAALSSRGRLNDLGEFTFEHYPYDVPCGRLDRKLLVADKTLSDGIARLKTDGVPRRIPWTIIEYGFSAFSGQSAVELPAGLFDADMVANFLAHGGHGGYLLGYGPEELFDPENACAGYGELMLFGQKSDGRASWATPAFWSSVLLTGDWAEPGDGRHLLYPATWTGARDGQPWVVAYPVVRPDGRMAILVINRNPRLTEHVRLELRQRAGSGLTKPLGPLEVLQYGPEQYAWKADGPAGHPVRDLPPRRSEIMGRAVSLPPYSISVVRTLDARFISPTAIANAGNRNRLALANQDK